MSVEQAGRLLADFADRVWGTDDLHCAARWIQQCATFKVVTDRRLIAAANLWLAAEGRRG